MSGGCVQVKMRGSKSWILDILRGDYGHILVVKLRDRFTTSFHPILSSHPDWKLKRFFRLYVFLFCSGGWVMDKNQSRIGISKIMADSWPTSFYILSLAWTQLRDNILISTEGFFPHEKKRNGKLKITILFHNHTKRKCLFLFSCVFHRLFTIWWLIVKNELQSKCKFKNASSAQYVLRTLRKTEQPTAVLKCH